MSTPSPTSPPKRPRLSLQIKAIANGPSGRTSRTLAAAVDVKSPTAFNTLSNVYATAVDRSTPVQDKPPTTVLSGGKPSLRLQTQESGSAKDRRAHTPYLGPYLDTPLTAQPMSPAATKATREVCFPSSMTATPPMSAQEQKGSHVFTFEASTVPTPTQASRSLQTPHSARRRTTMPVNLAGLPYTHPRSLRSILRNSPLPPLSTRSPESPRRQSVRLQEKAARRVAYNSPLCQTITTSKYVKSHIDLLTEDSTPTTPSADNDDVLDQTMAYTGNETRDGGQTPGPFEEMRRRMAGLNASTPVALTPAAGGGIRKRGKKKEKKRRWVWTIGQEDEEGGDIGSPGSVLTAIEKPLTAIPIPVPVPRKAVSVPVIALPAPRLRTRMQMAKAVATATALQMPASTPASVVPVHATQESTPAPAPAPAPAPEPTPSFASHISSTPEPPTPAVVEPPTPSLSVNSSITSMSHDSVFEASGDVEMSDSSDASSIWSEAGEDLHPHLHHRYQHPKYQYQAREQHVGLGGTVPAAGKLTDMDHDMIGGDAGGDVDMDSDTPIVTARPMMFGGPTDESRNRGWAPWIVSSS